LPDASGPEHIEAFASSARSYAQRLLPIWDLPHHQYRDVLVTVGGMAGAACAEWHLHAWDFARALGKDYRPADPDILLRGWAEGMPHLLAWGGLDRAEAEEAAVACGRAGRLAGPAVREDPWHVMLRASGRIPVGRISPGPLL
jgi:hypothetical protein